MRYTYDRTRAGVALIARQQFGYTVRFSPSRRLALLAADWLHRCAAGWT